MIDFERGAKTTGSKFYFTTGQDAWKEWCLITRMLQYHTANGYEMVIPPHLVDPLHRVNCRSIVVQEVAALFQYRHTRCLV